MKKYIKYISVFLTLSIGFAACSEEEVKQNYNALDSEPDTNITYDNSWSSYDDACTNYTKMLTAIGGVVGGSAAYVPEAMADLFNLRASAASLAQEHRWVFTTNQFSGDAVWENNFSLVMQANDFIANIDAFIKAEVFGSQTQKRLQHYKGVAYFARAFAYTNMIVRYCKDYEPETAANELGLPIVTTVDKDACPARATLQETVDFILSDFKNAEDNLQAIADFDNTDNLYHPGLDALDALQMRFALYTHDFDKAIDKANIIIDNYPLAASVVEMQRLWVLDAGCEIIFEPARTPEDRVNGYGNVYISYDIREIGGAHSIYGYSPYLVPTQGVVDLYEDGDTRKNVYFTNPWMQETYPKTKLSNTSTDDLAESAWLLFKYPGNENLVKNDWDWYSNPYNMSKAFRVAEAYLTAAEAYLRKPIPNETKARMILNDLRYARRTFEWDATTTGAELVQEMENEWTREFLGEGKRLDCLKRWHKGFKRMEAQHFNGNLLTSLPNAGYQDLEISAEDKRFVWEIPTNARQTNPNLQPNW